MSLSGGQGGPVGGYGPGSGGQYPGMGGTGPNAGTIPLQMRGHFVPRCYISRNVSFLIC